MRYLNEIYTLRFGDCGFSRPAAAAWLGVAERTLLRHEQLPDPRPGPIYRALRLKAGYLEDIDATWRGWRLVEGRLCWPGDRGLTAGQIMAMAFERQRIRELERRIQTGIPAEKAGQIVPFLSVPAARNGG
jgi:hypothetical protein